MQQVTVRDVLAVLEQLLGLKELTVTQPGSFTVPISLHWR